MIMLSTETVPHCHHSDGERGSLNPGGGAVKKQLSGVKVGVKVGVAMSACHEIHLDMVMVMVRCSHHGIIVTASPLGCLC